MSWFLVLDLSEARRSWPDSFVGNARVLLRQASTLDELNLRGPFRVSPVFPLNERSWSASPPLSSGSTTTIEFHDVPSGFRALARLTAKLADDDLVPFAFNIGTVPVISLSAGGPQYDTVAGVVGVDYPFERWVVGPDGLLLDVQARPYHPHDGPPTEVAALVERCGVTARSRGGYENLPDDARGVVDEFVGSIDTLIPELASTFPSELLRVERLVAEVNRLIAMLISSGTTLSEDQQREAHQIVDRIVQVNSSLSYVSSQYTAGAIPILTRRALVRRYSLLGVGTAAKALVYLLESVNFALAEGQVESTISKKFRAQLSKPLPGLVVAHGHDPSHWADFNVDRQRDDEAGSVVRRTKMPFFSGRLGFRETEFAISAALQSLWSGDALEWNLVTMTHEILHGHVRHVLQHIFEEFEGAPEGFDRLREKLVEVWKHRDVDLSTLESIQIAILSYCAQVPLWGSMTTEPRVDKLMAMGQDGGDPMPIPSSKVLRSILEAEHRNVSEIFVHVLDLHYIFGGDLVPYLQSLWRSWGAVPSVGGDLRHYVLRSLVAAASTTTGRARKRFDDSVALLREAVADAVPSYSAYDLSPQVEAYLNNGEEDSLYFPFEASLRLVDLVRHVLVSGHVRRALLADDDLVELEESSGPEPRLVYNLRELEMVEAGVKSATAFLWDRTARLLKGEVSSPDVERRTAWVLLALAANARGES